MNKSFYIPDGDAAILDKLYELLNGQAFGTWVLNQAKDWIDKNEVKGPEPPKIVCQHARMLKEGKFCRWEDCPLLNRTYGPVAQKREFEAKEKCLFRLLP